MKRSSYGNMDVKWMSITEGLMVYIECLQHLGGHIGGSMTREKKENWNAINDP
jgi:hypothetical protein